MNLSHTLPEAVYTLWITTIVIVVLIVPVAVALLQRTLNAALGIRRYLAEMETAGAGIAANTASIVALGDTDAVAKDMLQTAGGLEQHSGQLSTLLVARATQGGLL